MTRKTLDDLAVLLVQLDPADDAAYHELRAAFDEILASPRYAKPVKTSIVQAVMALEDGDGDASSRGPALTEVHAHLERAMKLHETPSADVTAKRSEPRRRGRKTSPTQIRKAPASARPETKDPVVLELASDANTPGQSELLAPDADRSLAADFVSESREYLESSEAALLRLEAEPRDAESINTIFRAFHTIKGTSGFLGVRCAMELAHEAESLLTRMRDGTLVCCAETADLIFHTIDALKLILDQVERALHGESAAVPPAFADALTRLRNPDAARCNPPAVSAAEPVETPVADATAAASRSETTRSADAMVRVRTERLDQLIEMVGELVIAQSMLSQDETVRHARNVDLSRKVAHAEKIVRELQDLSMALRMVPLKGPFQKVTRLVRDLAHRNGKQVDVESDGEDTEIDRNLVDVLSDPLVHMVRNAVDHGLETPDAREQAGKPRTGRIRLSAYHAGGNVVVELSDDGRGLDRERIVRKAVERGVIPSGDGLSSAEIDNLIFVPGFSTAEQVTDISGRGVGMDVV
ncbi:MAG TPA: Hpt domain-containing protein, partial [Gemmatimonadaceae bacterium]